MDPLFKRKRFLLNPIKCLFNASANVESHLYLFLALTSFPAPTLSLPPPLVRSPVNSPGK